MDLHSWGHILVRIINTEYAFLHNHFYEAGVPRDLPLWGGVDAKCFPDSIITESPELRIGT